MARKVGKQRKWRKNGGKWRKSILQKQTEWEKSENGHLCLRQPKWPQAKRNRKFSDLFVPKNIQNFVSQIGIKYTEYQGSYKAKK